MKFSPFFKQKQGRSSKNKKRKNLVLGESNPRYYQGKCPRRAVGETLLQRSDNFGATNPFTLQKTKFFLKKTRRLVGRKAKSKYFYFYYNKLKTKNQKFCFQNAECGLAS